VGDCTYRRSTKTTTVTATFQFNATVANPHQFDPYIDTYGQAIAASWPSKITSDSDLQTAVAQEQAWLASDPPVAALDQYGGSTIAGWTGQAIGYYYAAFHKGHWYMISPLGNPLFYLGVTSIGDGPTAITGANRCSNCLLRAELLRRRTPPRKG
jgi:hypothetical protein